MDEEPPGARLRAGAAARAGAWLRRRGLGLGLVLAYLYVFPYFPAIHSANERPRAYLVQAIADHGTFVVDDGVRRWGATADVSPSEGHYYSNKAPGSSLLAVPAYLVVEGATRLLGRGRPSLALTIWACRVATGVVPTLLFVWLLWGFLARWAPRPETRRLIVVAYALGSMAMTYSVLFISHQLSAVLIGTGWILAVWVVEDGRDARWMIAAGAAAGAAVLVDYQAAFAGVPVAVYVVWRLARTDRARLGRAVALAAAGAAVPVGVLLWYHDVCFGSPLRTGYALSETFAHFHQKGLLGITKLRWVAFAGSTVSLDNGLLTFCPILLAAVPGGVLLWRRGQRRHAAVMAAVAIIYIAFISSINFWRGGWQMGPRYITAMLPFLLPGIAAAAAWADDDARRWWARGALVGLALVGVVVYAGSCAEYPHFPEVFKNPLYEVTLRLVREGHAPYDAAWLVGVRGVWGLVPYAAVVVALVAWAARAPGGGGGDDGGGAGARWPRWRPLALGAALAAAVLAAYAAFPGGGPRAAAAYARWVGGAMPDAMSPEARAYDLEETCGDGDAAACREAGIAFAEGPGVPHQPGHAADLFRRACDGGDAEGCRRAGARR